MCLVCVCEHAIHLQSRSTPKHWQQRLLKQNEIKFNVYQFIGNIHLKTKSRNLHSDRIIIPIACTCVYFAAREIQFFSTNRRKEKCVFCVSVGQSFLSPFSLDEGTEIGFKAAEKNHQIVHRKKNGNELK